VIRRYWPLFGASVAVSLALLGGTALADVHGNNNSNNNDDENCPFTVTGLALQSVSSQNNQTTIDVAITVLDNGNQGGTWFFPDPSNAAMIGGNPNAVPAINITDTSTGQPLATNVPASALVPPTSDPSVTAGQTQTAVYAFDIPTPVSSGDTYSISLVDQPSNSDNVFHMYQPAGAPDGGTQWNTAPVCNAQPPLQTVGELPEVPLAAGLPLVGIGAAGAVWLRRRGGLGRRPA
jgi:hypothetical protein